MAEATARGKVTGYVNDTGALSNKAIVWWHDSSAPFVVIIKFSADCSTFSVRFLKAQFNGTTPVAVNCSNGLDGVNDKYQFYMAKKTSGTYSGKYMPVLKDVNTGVSYSFPDSNVDTQNHNGVYYIPTTSPTASFWNNSYGMGFYVALAKSNADINALANVTASNLWTGRNTGSYGYPFRNNSLYLCDLPNKNSSGGTYNPGTIKSFNEYFSFDSADYGIKDKVWNSASKIAIFGCCEAGLSGNSNDCWSFPTMTEDKKGFFATIMDVNLNLVFPPMDIQLVTAKTSGTTLAAQIKWTPSSKFTSDVLHYRVRNNSNGRYINISTGEYRSGTTAANYYTKNPHTYNNDKKNYAEILCKGLVSGVTYVVDYYITMPGDSTKYGTNSVSRRTISLDAYIASIQLDRINVHAYSTGNSSGISIASKTIKADINPTSSPSSVTTKTLNNSTSDQTITGLVESTEYDLKIYFSNVKAYTLTGDDFTFNSIGNTGAGEIDVVYETQFTTNTGYQVDTATVSVTGRTVTVTEKFILNNSRNLTVSFSLYRGSARPANLVAQATLYSSVPTQNTFTYAFLNDIDPGTDYVVTCNAVDDANLGNFMSLYCQTYKLELSTTDTSGNTVLLPYSDSSGKYKSVSTRAVAATLTVSKGYDSESNYKNSTIEVVVSGEDGNAAEISVIDTATKSVKYIIADHLRDAEEYALMFYPVKVNTKTGAATELTDAAESIAAVTKQLLVWYRTDNITINSCEVTVNAYALDPDTETSATYDEDPITGYKTSLARCYPEDDVHGSHFQAILGTSYGYSTKTADPDKAHVLILQEGTPGSQSTTNFYSSGTKSKVIEGLDYFTTYNVRIAITDGYNTAVADSVNITTEFPFVRIYNGNSYKNAIPLLCIGGVAKPAAALIADANGDWKYCNPE